MPIDISDKEQLNVPLTGTQMNDAIVQAHKSRDAIANIEGMSASASEIDAKISESVLLKTPLMVEGGDTKLTNFIPDKDKSFKVQFAFNKIDTQKDYVMNLGVQGYGGNARVLIGTGYNALYIRVGSYVFNNDIRVNGRRIIEIEYNGNSKTISLILDGEVVEKNISVTIENGTTPIMIGGKTKVNLTPELNELGESDVLFCRIYDDTASESLSLKELRSKIYGNCDQIAHRGLRSEVPENTMAAFRYATKRGIKHLECDVQVTSDGKLVLIHDSTVDRTTNGTGSVVSMAYSTIEGLDAGSSFSPVYQGEKIPTFAEFCKFAKENDCTIYPEIKGYRSTSDIESIIDMIVDYGLVDKSVVQSFSHSDLVFVNNYNSDIKLGYLSSDIFDVSTMLPNSYALINANALLSDTSYVQTIHQAGHKIGVWTVDDWEKYSRLLDANVDSIMVDSNYSGN